MAGRIYETAIKIGAKLSSTFRPEILGGAAAISRLGAAAQKLRSAEKATESFTRLSTELAAARAKYDNATDALARLKAAEKAAGGATKESAKWTAAGARTVAAAGKELDRLNKAAGQNAAALHAAGVKTGNLAVEQARLALAIAATERRTELATAINGQFGKSLEAIRERAKGYSTIEGSIGKVGGAVKSLLGDAMKLAGLGAAAGLGLFELAKHTAEAGHELETTATRLGTTTTALQILRSAGRKTGVEIEALDTGLGKLAINIGKAMSAKGKGGGAFSGEVGGFQMLVGKVAAPGATVDPFKAIGLSAKDLAKEAPEEQVKKIADAINKLKTHSQQAAAAVAIFGKGSLAMLPLIAKGGKGLEELYGKARSSGNLLGGETIENAKKFHLAYLAMQDSVGAVRNTLGAALLPVATRVFGQITKWVQENREKIKAWAETAANWIENKAIPAIEKLVPQIMAVAKQVAGWIEKGAALTGGIGNLAIALAALRLVPLGASVLSLVGNLGKLAASLVTYTAKTWSAHAAAKALAAAQEGGAGVGSVVTKAGGSFLGTAGAGGGLAGAALAIKAALAAPTIGAAIATGGLAITAGLVAAAGGIGVAIGTGIRKMFDTDEAIAGRGGLLDRLTGIDRNGDDDAETNRLNQLGRTAGAARRAREAAAVSPIGPAVPRATGSSTHHAHYAPVTHIHGSADKEVLDASKKKDREEFERQWNEMHARKQRLSYG